MPDAAPTPVSLLGPGLGLSLGQNLGHFLLADEASRSWAPWTTALLLLAAGMVALLWQKNRHLDLRARMQRRLDETERLKDLGIMAGGLAHEIRHPVSSIQFAVASGRERLAKLPESEESAELDTILEGIRGDVKRLEEITNAFLQYARPEKQTAVACDLRDATESVDRFLRVEMRSRGVRLEPSYPDSPVVVRIPEVHLRQILMNLVLNAVQASPEGGAIRLEIAAGRDMGTVTLEDEGPGVPEDAEPNLFKPFFTTKSKGVGLGLALSRRFARDAGGEIIYRPGERGGAVFRLELPLERDEVS